MRRRLSDLSDFVGKGTMGRVMNRSPERKTFDAVTHVAIDSWSEKDGLGAAL
jgi:hypothetical protein